MSKLAQSFLLSMFVCMGAACSKMKVGKSKPVEKKVIYTMVDGKDRFQIIRESGIHKNKQLVTKTLVLNESGDLKKPLEKSVVISDVGKLRSNNTKINILRPRVSQHNVWLEGKKFFAELKINPKHRSMDVNLRSPVKKWNGKSRYSFPSGTGVFCYFSQLVECIRATGFINTAIKKGTGKINFHIIWDGFPYFQDQYINIPNELFARASLKFNGVNKLGEKRFTLSVAGQTIFYHLNKKNTLEKLFWISQGLTITRNRI